MRDARDLAQTWLSISSHVGASAVEEGEGRVVVELKRLVRSLPLRC